MTQSRFPRRTALAAGAAGVAAFAAACNNDEAGGGGGGAAPAEYEETGPIVLATGKDTSGNLQNQLDAFNEQNPGEEVTLRELPDSADQQRQQMIQNAQNQSDAFTVLNVDVVWTAEFAANQYIDELPAGAFDMSQFLPTTVETATYFGKQYAVPTTSDGALLYYRTDWYEQAGLTDPPKTWDELVQHAAEIKAKVPEAKSADVYGGQFQKYEGLTCNFAEFINGAGGAVVDEEGKPTVNSAEAIAGLQQLVDWFADGTIPQAGLTWQEEQSRVAFQDGKIMYLRNWPYVYALAEKDDGSSKVNGNFAVAPIPGKSGPGVSTLGGHNYAINKFAKNKGTAVKFISYMSAADTMKANLLATSNAPTRPELYTEPDLTSQFPYLPILLDSIKQAKPRPKVVKYGDVTTAIQDAAYAALQGQKSPSDALNELQTKLEGLIS